MSDDLYQTLLYFDGRRGLAKAEGVAVELSEAPMIEPLPKHTAELYYYPGVRDFRIRESADAVRNLYPPEIEAIIKLLASVAAYGRGLREQLARRKP